MPRALRVCGCRDGRARSCPHRRKVIFQQIAFYPDGRKVCNSEQILTHAHHLSRIDAARRHNAIEGSGNHDGGTPALLCPVAPQYFQSLASFFQMRGMDLMTGFHRFQFFATGSAQPYQFLRALQFFVFGVEFGLCGNQRRLCFRQVTTEDLRERLSPLDGLPQFRCDLSNDAACDGRYMHFVIPIGLYGCGDTDIDILRAFSHLRELEMNALKCLRRDSNFGILDDLPDGSNRSHRCRRRNGSP